jgi:hypothetical protein
LGRAADTGIPVVILYHATTPKKAKLYRDSGYIKSPVRGFDTLLAALFWALNTGRQVIYKVSGELCYKLPDHHNKFGNAYWIDENVPVERIKCVR